jgi:hypothetical protein
MGGILVSLYHGQKLLTKNGEEVTVKHIIEGVLTVEYKGKLYKRPLNIIGEKLFVKDNDKNQRGKHEENYEPANIAKPSSYSSRKTPPGYIAPWSKIPGNWPKAMKGPYGRFSYKKSK